jgi:hypothetical protein
MSHDPIGLSSSVYPSLMAFKKIVLDESLFKPCQLLERLY